jgi:hypothetical protein
MTGSKNRDTICLLVKNFLTEALKIVKNSILLMNRIVTCWIINSIDGKGTSIINSSSLQIYGYGYPAWRPMPGGH